MSNEISALSRHFETYNWGFWCRKQVSQAGISNYIPHQTVGCNYSSLPEIPASGTEVLNYGVWYLTYHDIWRIISNNCPHAGLAMFGHCDMLEGNHSALWKLIQLMRINLPELLSTVCWTFYSVHYSGGSSGPFEKILSYSSSRYEVWSVVAADVLAPLVPRHLQAQRWPCMDSTYWWLSARLQ